MTTVNPTTRLPEPALEAANTVLRRNGTVLISACTPTRAHEALNQLGVAGIPAPDRGRDNAEAFGTGPGLVLVFDDYVTFPSDFPAPYDLRLEYNPTTGWNTAAVRTHGARRYFAKPGNLSK